MRPSSTESTAPSPATASPALRALALRWDSDGAHFRTLNGGRRDLQDGRTAPPESFSPAVIADLLLGLSGADRVVEPVLEMLRAELREAPALFFFKDHALLPADADCTAIAASLLLRAGGAEGPARRALDLILANVGEGGVIATYFDASGERAGILDPVVCANALYLAHQLGRGAEAAPTAAYLRRFLVEEGYLEGTRYYPAPETFLYFLGRLVFAFPGPCAALREPLRRAVEALPRTTRHPIDLAQRILLRRACGLPTGAEAALLRHLQGDDGAWPADSLFRYGRRSIYFGSAALSTAFAAAALAAEPGCCRG